jgi:hypothetical protein
VNVRNVNIENTQRFGIVIHAEKLIKCS